MIKAWMNKEPVRKAEQKTYEGDPATYRMFNGFTFVFVNQFNKRYRVKQKVLITVYDPRVVNH